MSLNTSATANDAVHLVNIAITNMVNKENLTTSWTTAETIDGIKAGGDIDIGTCDTVKQSDKVRAKFSLQLQQTAAANASLMAQLTADSEINLHNAHKKDLKVTENTHTVTRLVIGNTNEMIDNIKNSCEEDTEAKSTYVVRNVSAGGNVHINFAQDVVQDSLLKCTIKGIVTTDEQNSGGITDDQSDTSKLTVSNSPAIQFSSILGIIIAIILVLIVTSMIREARILLAWFIAFAGLVCTAAGCFLTFGFGSFGVPMGQLSKQYDSSNKDDKTKWVQSALVPFRRNWFEDEEQIKKGSSPLLTGYASYTNTASGDTKSPSDPIHVGEIPSKLKLAHDADSSIVACVWHRDVPYETILDHTLNFSEKVETKSLAPPDKSFWPMDAISPDTTDRVTVGGKPYSHVGLFELLQMSDPTKLRDNAAITGAKGKLYLYKLGSGYQTSADSENYLNCTKDGNLAHFPGVSEGWPSGLVAPSGKQSTMVYDESSGKAEFTTYSQKAFPISKDASGLVHETCEQSCMVVGPKVDNSYTPMAISDLMAPEESSNLDSQLDVNAKFNIEKAVIPFLSYATFPALSLGDIKTVPWANSESARTSFYGQTSFESVNAGQERFWKNTPLSGGDTVQEDIPGLFNDSAAPLPIRIRQPVRDLIPAPGGDWTSSGNPNKGLWNSFRVEGDTYTCAESLFPAWAIANRVLDKSSSAEDETANPTEVANSVMQFMVMPLSNNVYNGMPCADMTEECAINNEMLQMFVQCCIIIVVHAGIALLGFDLTTSGMLSGILFADILILVTGPVALVGVVVLTISQGIWSRGVKSLETYTSDKAGGKCVPCEKTNNQ